MGCISCGSSHTDYTYSERLRGDTYERDKARSMARRLSALDEKDYVVIELEGKYIPECLSCREKSRNNGEDVRGTERDYFFY